jgi:hypothetical protein
MYAEVALDASEAAAVSSWRAVASVEGRRLTVAFEDALCPECGHDSAAQPWIRRVVAAATFGLRPTVVESTTERHPVTCACTEQHAGRDPKIPHGCGRSWSVEFDWSVNGTRASVGPVRAGPPPTAADLGFAAAVGELKKKELEGVRAQAAGWAKILAGLTGLLGAGQLLAGPTFAAKLAAGWANVVGVLLVVAVILAAASAVAAGLASLGRPQVIELTGSRDAGGAGVMLEGITDDLVARTRRPLTVAAWTAAAAFLIAVVVGAMLWWAPRADSPDASICVDGPTGVVTLASLPAVRSGALTVVPCR